MSLFAAFTPQGKESLRRPDSGAVGGGRAHWDEILGGTINFNQLSKTEVLEVLELMKPYDEFQVLTRNKMSKSVGNLDQITKSPETMLNDSYNKLYNNKIKKFMKSEEELSAKPTDPGSSKMGLPRLGVDFGLMKPKPLITDIDDDSESDEGGELTYNSNLNLPPLGFGSNGTTISGAQVPRLKVDARGPQFNAQGFNVSGSLPEGRNPTAGIQLPRNGHFRSPEMGMDLKGLDASAPDIGTNHRGGTITGPSLDFDAPKVGFEGPNRMPKFKLPDLGLSGPSFSSSEGEVNTPDIGTSGKLGLRYSKRHKYPDLNVDNPSGYLESPKLRLSGRPTDLDLEMPGVDESQLELYSPDFDIGSPKGKFSMPKLTCPA
ncbi:hypothetical protein F7725_006099 [Dissostichus mawsoni]|uniref:Uncharacterized protein n=1 Tax=Dissostichus mawsoni TaxID=36200 RepID=A0A7J5YT25_DISMA|nr:hypothetical protein F7725_006099 [Dissostichus mawsoni]